MTAPHIHERGAAETGAPSFYTCLGCGIVRSVLWWEGAEAQLATLQAEALVVAWIGENLTSRPRWAPVNKGRFSLGFRPGTALGMIRGRMYRVVAVEV